MSTITIIVPIYKVEKYLAKCIDSILKQSFNDFELFLINDGSPDKCGEICEKYAKKDKRIKVIHKENEGVSSARNLGIEMAHGEYIAFVDPDDTIEPNMYSLLLEKAINHQVDMVICPIRTVNINTSTNTVSTVWNKVNSPINRDEIEGKLIPAILSNKTYSLVSCVNKLYRKSFFNQNNIRFEKNKHHSEDARINFKILTLIDSIVFIDIPLYNYYIYPRDSLTQIFREDLYEYIIDNKKLLLELASRFDQEINSSSIRNHFSTVTLLHMEDVVRNKINLDSKYKILTNILMDKEFIEDISRYNSKTRYYTLLKYICLLKSAKLFSYIVKIKHKIKGIVHENK